MNLLRRDGTVEFGVPFHDVDLTGVVWHGHYYKYFELARSALLRACDLDDGAVLGHDYRLVVIESRCRHVSPLRYGDRVRVVASFAGVSHRIEIVYEIENLTAERVSARGVTILASLDARGRLLLKTPERIRRRIEA